MACVKDILMKIKASNILYPHSSYLVLQVLTVGNENWDETVAAIIGTSERPPKMLG